MSPTLSATKVGVMVGSFGPSTSGLWNSFRSRAKSAHRSITDKGGWEGDTVEQNQAAQSALGKAARRLLPFLCLCYAVNFLDRVKCRLRRARHE